MCMCMRGAASFCSYRRVLHGPHCRTEKRCCRIAADRRTAPDIKVFCSHSGETTCTSVRELRWPSSTSVTACVVVGPSASCVKGRREGVQAFACLQRYEQRGQAASTYLKLTSTKAQTFLPHLYSSVAIANARRNIHLQIHSSILELIGTPIRASSPGTEVIT